MNRQEIRDRILQALNESIATPTFFSLAEINDVIDEASEIIAEEVSQLKRTAYIPRRNGTFLYSLESIAPNIMSPYRVWLSEDDTRLQFITMRQLDNYRQQWWEVTSDSPDWWFPAGWNAFGVWPGTATGGGYLRVDYLSWPDPLLDDLEEPEYTEYIHDAFILYGIYDGLLKQWNVPQSADYFTQFVQLWTDRKFYNETKATRARIAFRRDFGSEHVLQHIDLPTNSR
jgi:hypothetical protein